MFDCVLRGILMNMLFQFTKMLYNRVVAPKQEATFDYAFFASEQYAGRPVGLVVELNYEDSEGTSFVSTIFNETVVITEDDTSFNTETGFLYIIFAAVVVLTLLAGQHFLSKVFFLFLFDIILL